MEKSANREIKLAYSNKIKEIKKEWNGYKRKNRRGMQEKDWKITANFQKIKCWIKMK